MEGAYRFPTLLTRCEPTGLFNQATKIPDKPRTNEYCPQIGETTWAQQSHKKASVVGGPVLTGQVSCRYPYIPTVENRCIF